MEQLKNLADSRLTHGCVYCGDRRERLTRDHVPSRVFLDRPYPSNLPVVVACLACNNSFSPDEEYVACLVECARVGSTDPQRLGRETIRRILRDSSRLRGRIERSRRETNGNTEFVVEPDRVRAVMLKLARGHAAFEFGRPLRTRPDSIDWWIFPKMKDVESFDAAHVHHLIGEVGSRATQRMMVVSVPLGSPELGQVETRLVVSDWVEVQDQRYRYLAVDDLGKAVVKIIIGEYFAGEVTWTWRSVDQISVDERAAP